MDDDRAAAPYAIIVDDNPTILLYAADLLEDEGYCTFAAADCHQALASFREHGDRIRLLFTNVQIPGPMDGFELARFARKHWPSIGIVVSSGHTTPTAGEMPNGALFLAKPFAAGDVRTAVSRVTRRASPAPMVATLTG